MDTASGLVFLIVRQSERFGTHTALVALVLLALALVAVAMIAGLLLSAPEPMTVAPLRWRR